MSIDWSQDRVEALSNPEILALRDNARERGRLEVVALCDQVLLARKPVRRTSAPRKSSPTKLLEAECSKKLSDLAVSLASKHDLSVATAKKKSIGIKGFIPHQLTAKNGTAKLGGEQRTGAFLMDRYISYRVGDEAVALAAVLISDDPEESLRWQVLGPQRLSQDLVPSASLRPYAPDSISTLYSGGVEFTDFEPAAVLFEQLIAHLADRI